MRFEHSVQLWPWSGFLALYVRITPEGAAFKVPLHLLWQNYVLAAAYLCKIRQAACKGAHPHT